MRYRAGWQHEVQLSGWRKYWRVFWIGFAVQHGGDPEQQDREFFKRWARYE